MKKPVANSMAIKSLGYQLGVLKNLRRDKESPHAFVKKVLETYDKNTVITDDMFLSYNRITDFKSKVSSAFNEYMNSEKNAEALDKLLRETAPVNITISAPRKRSGRNLVTSRM